MESKKHKEESLGLLEVFCIASGAMISSGLFVLPAVVYSKAGTGIIPAYFLAGIMMIPALLSKVELATAMPKSGGTYFYIYRSLGPMLGNFAGFANWFSIALKGAFALIGIGAFMQLIYPGITMFQIKLVALFFILFFTILNLVSVESTGHVQDLMVFALLGILIYYNIIGWPKADLTRLTTMADSPFDVMLGIAGTVFISYGGLTKVASLAGEVRNPGKTLPRGMFLSYIVVNGAYLFTIAVTLALLTPQEMLNSLTPLSIGAGKVAGRFGMVLLSIAAIFSFATTANASLMSASRLPVAMSRDGLLPEFFQKHTKKKDIPWLSVVLTGIFMALVILGLNLENLVKTASTMMLILFLLVNMSVILMRESRIVSYRPIFRTPFYPFFPILGILFSTVLIFKMGNLPLLLALFFFMLSTAWFIFYRKDKPKAESALIRIVERVVSSEVRDGSLHNELTTILRERDNIEDDRFDGLIRNAIILDIKREISRDELSEKIAQAFSLRMDIPMDKIRQKLEERESDSSTAISDDLAIPHIVLDEDAGFDIVVVRLKEGVQFTEDRNNIRIVFALAGAKGERNFHLQALMAIAQIVQSPDFVKKWDAAEKEEDLRGLILLAERRR
ncbi:MAG: amino acid permease [Spirochaetales bacterium]|nr:amino acid permease [Spirochaetales bacterium]